MSSSMLCIVKPLSAIMDIPEMEPTNTGDMNEMAPFGVQATRNFEVLWCLY